MKKHRIILISFILAVVLFSLSGCGLPGFLKHNPENEDEVTKEKYSVYCCDEDHNPVEGAAIQFCDDRSCQVSKSGSDGYAYIDADANKYEVHALKAPVGYQIVSEDTFNLSSTSRTCEFVFALEPDTSKFVLEGKPPVKFSTVDINGNPVDESIFGNAKITLINFFEDWCSWCIEEMPDLQELSEKYGKDGLQVIGVYCLDEELSGCVPSTESGVKEIASELGITYSLIEYSKDFKYLEKFGRPISYMVNSKGEILHFPDADSYEAFAELLIKFDVEYYHEFYDDKEVWEGLSEESQNEITNYFNKYKNAYPKLLKEVKEEYWDDSIYTEGCFDGYYPGSCWECAIRTFLGMDGED